MTRLAWLAFGIGATWMLLWGIWGAEARTPWAAMGLMGLAAPVSWASLMRTRSHGRVASATVLTILAVTAWVAVCVLMAFPAFAAPERIPSLVTTDQEGNTVDETAFDRATLLVFFRGKW